MQKFAKNLLVEEELRDLKSKVELIEGDRKAYYEISQWTIRHNRERIAQLKTLNKEARLALSRLKSTVGTSIADVKLSSLTDVDKFDHKVWEQHKRCDDLLSVVEKKKKVISIKQDSLSQLYLERSSSLQLLLGSQSPSHKSGSFVDCHEINVLENRLDKASLKYTEAQTIRKVYEQVIKKLQEERLNFDKRLRMYEKAIKQKKSEAESLKLLSNDAIKARELAKDELTRVDATFQEERKAREKSLNDKKALVRTQMELNDQIEKKVLAKEENVPEQNQLHPQNRDGRIVDEVAEKKMAVYEELFRQLKEGMGVNKLEEVITKFKGQDATLEHLLQLREENETKLAEMKKEKAKMTAEFNNTKFTGNTKFVLMDKNMEDLKAMIKKEKQDSAILEEEYKKTESILMKARTGLSNLHDKLEILPVPPKEIYPSKDDSPVLYHLNACIDKLNWLSDWLHEKGIKMEEYEDVLATTLTSVPRYNCRVRMAPTFFEIDQVDDEEYDNEEVLDREAIKRQAAHIIHNKSKNKTLRRFRKKKS